MQIDTDHVAVGHAVESADAIQHTCFLIVVVRAALEVNMSTCSML